MKKVNGKLPRVNGSVNPSLTLDEALQFEKDIQLQITWSIHCELSCYTEFKELYKGLPANQKASYDTMSQDPTKWIKIYWKHKTSIQAKYNSIKDAQDLENGKKIFQAMKECSIRGELRMNKSQIIGYVQMIGNWNEFNAASVQAAIRETELILPRKDYGINNPNTDISMHQWLVDGDYIMIELGYLGSSAEAERILQFKDQVGQIWKKANVDSFRHYIEYDEYSKRPTYLKFIMWWD